MRRLIQFFSLTLFSLLFIWATFQIPDWLPADLYLRLDPLVALSTLLASREWIPRILWSVLILGATGIIGRFFCAYVCPMGAVIDFLDPLWGHRRNRQGIADPRPWRKVKYFALIFFTATSILGVTSAYLMDPIPLLTRVYTFFFYPLAITLLNLGLDLFRPLFRALGWISLSHHQSSQPFFYMSLLTFIIFAGIVIASRITPRFWCRYLCPLGAMLSFISPLGRWNRHVSKNCNQCGRCAEECPMGAIGEDPGRTQLAECIQCRTCQKVCPPGAIHFGIIPSPPGPALVGGEYSTFDLSRREWLFAFGGGLLSGFLIDHTPYTPLRGKHQLIRPPGAIPETEFLRACIRCGECMKSCLTNTLQPCFWEGGFSGLWTPRMDLRLAPCEQNCNACGKVCPTQAIRSLPLEEKNHAKVGTALIWKERCLVWAQDKICLVCDEICPYNAIVFRTFEGYRRPVVIASRCNGCGYCEQKCPVQGESAIVVVPNGEIRLKEGSYLQEAKKLQLQFRPDPGDDQYVLKESGLEVKAEVPAPSKGLAPPSPIPAEKGKPQLPKGFR